MRLTITFLTLFAVFVSCKKDPQIAEPCEPIVLGHHSYDTIFPSEYLMAYPGSWWQYNGLLDSCTSWEAVPIRSVTTSGECVLVNEDMWILPEGLIYSGHNIAFDQSVLTSGEYDSTRIGPIFDTLVGVFYDVTYPTGYGEYAGTTHVVSETVERLDSMTIGSTTYYDVIHIRGTSDTEYHSGGGPNYFGERWFAKGVGLIKTFHGEGTWTGTVLELEDHYIAPH